MRQPRTEEVEEVAEESSGVSRRLAVGDASARSLLLTILGEFMLPRESPVWTSTLVAALAEVRVEEKSARQAIARTASEGLIVATRHGRRVQWLLSPAGQRLLSEGAERIYGFMAAAPQWHGQWLVLALTVPETQRRLRHRLRTRLTWAGLGSPAPGVWVTPDPSKEGEVAKVMAELGLTDLAFSYVGRFGTIGSEQRLVAQAWNLDELKVRYAGFIDRFAALAPDTDDEALRAQIELVQEWRRFPFLDPALPEELLPERWIGTAAARVFRAQHAGWHVAAQRRWAQLRDTATD
ncbi:PaaX family transcriptional regulator C-terminal domain-containing protein [soil metagenome]